MLSGFEEKAGLMNKYKLVIFDFDGTLADTFPFFLSVINSLAEKHDFKKVDEAKIEGLRTKGIKEMLKDSGLTMWKLPNVAKDFMSLMSTNLNTINMFEGLPISLKNLHEKGMLLAVVSSNSKENICGVLGSEISSLISYFECGVSIFGKHSKLKKILKKSCVSPDEIIYIGDEIRDIEAARETGISFGAVSWGYTEVSTLKACKPDLILNKTEDVFDKLSCHHDVKSL